MMFFYQNQLKSNYIVDNFLFHSNFVFVISIMNMLFLTLSSIQSLPAMLHSKVLLNDAPKPWQLNFQDGASPTQEGITELHDTIFFYLVVILLGVMWTLSSSIKLKFHSSKFAIAHKYANPGTLIRLIWTISPASILVAIAFPSFKLLYVMVRLTLHQ